MRVKASSTTHSADIFVKCVSSCNNTISRVLFARPTRAQGNRHGKYAWYGGAMDLACTQWLTTDRSGLSDTSNILLKPHSAQTICKKLQSRSATDQEKPLGPPWRSYCTNAP